MKDRLSLKDTFFVLSSRISPFGTVSIRTLKGLQVKLENLTDRDAPVSEEPKIDGSGKVTLPPGSTARILIHNGESETNLMVYDYRERPGHTHGAKIISQDEDIILDSKKRKKFIPEIGYTEYRNNL